MLNAESLPFSESDLNIKKSFEFNGIIYFLRLRKNKLYEFYSLDVFDELDNFIFSNILNYGRYFNDSVIIDLPIQFVLLNLLELFESKNIEKEINSETLGNDIKFYTSLEIS